MNSASPAFTWATIRHQIFQYKKPLVYAHLIALLATLVSVPIPLMMPLLVDEVLLNQPGKAISVLQNILPEVWHKPSAYILSILAVVVTLRLSSLVVGVLQARQFTFIGKQISFLIRQRLVEHLPKVELREYETQGSGGISARCITDVETLDKFISESLSKFLVALLTIIGTACILLWIDWQLGLIILLLNPAVIYFSRSFGSHVKDLKKKENAAFEAFQLALIETLDSIQQLRATQRESHYFSRVVGAAGELKDYAIASHWKTDAVNRLSFTIFLVGFEIFRAIAMLMVVFSDLTVGQIFAVFGYLWFMMGPVQEILSIQYSYFSANAAMARLNQLFELKQEPHYPCEVDPFASKQNFDIQFKDVNFSYTEESPVLKNVSLTLPAGKKVAIVSVSGGGKSTLVNLLLGLYQKDSGQILLDNAPIEKVGYSTIRSNIATVLQQPILFNTTVRENLNMGREHNDEELWQALRLAELQVTVEKLPQQLDTIVGRSGVRLSGGQKQRLAIARMILAKPQVVVLDEATSALDTDTEAKLHRNLQGFLDNRSTLIIAHRLSAIQQADLIYVLDDGEISQAGEHQELIQQAGLYQTLYQHQN
ncbi:MULTISPECIES: ABC transporter ATP-binding protein [unclassified Agarivorans]|uniref:ABC transporter ATP-binding protein n=1 Tax=unclassified Agarivorans TaxID=2636026 RepID=UPI0026E37533|nr:MULTISPECIES: ABC transporter ATP-binding protein [unclassified Agarivorans]MDO6684012.1 ABC transporter ATP-binding protein [Agarivorans sp. 3_MG-2023]MDO6714255.1 ABC transporter ATP-binding protein [Agarivorans sp. 2_MG-2023]